MNKKRIALAMSGGVDSSLSARLLMDAGYEVSGVTFLVHHDPAVTPPSVGAEAVCRSLNIPLTVLDIAEDFAATIKANFIAEYAAGRTPNPCVLCNRTIKFPYLMKFADETDCAYAATGHYARLIRCGSRIAVAKAKDLSKDQSYMLWQLPQETLARLVFPLGEYTKDEVREMAEAAGIPGAKTKDSQDICFIPQGDYTKFLAEAGMDLTPGQFIDEEGRVLGPSKNQACYTVGQRRGLGIALGQHMFVTARDAENNRVSISPTDPYGKTVYAENVRYMAAARGDLDSPRRLSVKLRYARAEFPCTAVVDGDRLRVDLDDPARAPSPGQSLVLYDGDTVVAGGVIALA